MQKMNPEVANSRPLCVDLDGTLVRTDTLIETLLQLIRRNPLVLLLMPVWLAGGLARFKDEVAQRLTLDAADLPYDETFLVFLRSEKAKGRRLVLVTAADIRQARAVAEHLHLFDDVIASDGTTNLKSAAKAAKLVDGFGVGGFDYAGNEMADMAVWRDAGGIILVNADTDACARIKAEREIVREFGGAAPGWQPYLKALRLHQWMKNGLVFVPLLLAHMMLDPTALLRASLAFVAFGLTASAVYVINDLVDLKEDRRHPRKRNRPFASGAVPLKHGLFMAPALLAGAGVVTLLLPLPFAGWLAVYFATTLAYSFFFKRTMLFDVLVLAGLYTLRIVAGSAALDIPRSFWLLAFSIFLFFSLALVKRYVELADMGRDADTRERGRSYRAVDLETLSQFGIGSGLMAVLVLALYIDSPTVKTAYANPELIWLLCPLMLYLICRFWILARRGEMHEDPIMFAIRDWRSQYIVAIAGFLLVIATLWS
ncbi:MAG: UbiA family prenyltransferase [Hyphomicrobiaceae bacterium]